MSSVTNNSADGKIEVGVIGWEGMVGLPLVLGVDRSPYEFFIQMPGHGWRIAAHELEQAMRQNSSLHRHLLRYAQANPMFRSPRRLSPTPTTTSRRVSPAGC